MCNASHPWLRARVYECVYTGKCPARRVEETNVCMERPLCVAVCQGDG